MRGSRVKSKFQLYMGFFVAFISFIQAYSQWEESRGLAYFFILGE